MNCKDTNQHIDDYIANQLDTALAESLNSHIDQCTRCQLAIANRKLLTEKLAAFKAPPLREGFVNSVIENAIHSNTTSDSSRSKHNLKWAYGTGFASAIAASFAVWFFVNMFFVQSEIVELPILSELDIAVYESKEISLLFNSPQSLDNAKVSLQLPENIEVEGYEGRRSLSWHTNLKAGRNTLSLPIYATNSGVGELVTKVEHLGKSKTIRFNINVDQIHQRKPVEDIKVLNQLDGRIA